MTKYMCQACNIELNISYKKRHEQTQKHLKNIDPTFIAFINHFNTDDAYYNLHEYSEELYSTIQLYMNKQIHYISLQFIWDKFFKQFHKKLLYTYTRKDIINSFYNMISEMNEKENVHIGHDLDL